MLVNLFHDSPREHHRLQMAGIALLASIGLLITLSIAIYDKKFVASTDVTVVADRAGLQLARFGDVRLYGALVGHVKEIDSDGERAVITVSLRPEAAEKIPADVGVRILPTTLFGQNYMELVPPTVKSSASPLADGAVIPADRVSTNVELQSILADLFPLLRSVKPADLNATLYALAHALQGKGSQIGDTLESLDGYLTEINREVPTLRTDLQLLSEVSQTYKLAAPDLVRLLRSATVTANTVTQRENDLVRSLSSLTGLASISRVTLAENEKDLILQGKAGRPLLALLDTYSPEVPCLLTGLDRQIDDTKNVFQDNMIHQTVELGAPQRPAYTADDAPSYGEVGRGPWCLGLPDDYPIPAKYLPLNDGSNRDELDGGIK
ncbi:virulence factor Mce [Aeromicrobium sp. A1-2]|uniref:MCE family protein n=1 Tax=Aeromicrobium sp. A1-2 TaxID=2107713 RepID=UPI000E5150DD|nr:MCE family protein [Aeromicrobium sp. A1-2]AXT84357.1 virulence factor Mce [Aeromicrobium sp. A1-2]